MAYSVSADVQALIKWTVFSTVSKVTLTEVTSHIADTDAYIDSRLGRLYATPITNSNDIKVLKFISARFAACTIAKILVLQTSGELPAIVRIWCEEATKRLEEILDFTLTLETPKTDDTRGLYSYTAHGNAANEYQPVTPVWSQKEDEW